VGLGLLATTSPHGSKSAGKADWTPLAGREVIILPDADDAGEGYAEDVSAILTTLTPTPKVRVVRLCDAWPVCPKAATWSTWWIVAKTQTPSRKSWQQYIDATEPEAPATIVPKVEAFKPFPTDADI